MSIEVQLLGHQEIIKRTLERSIGSTIAVNAWVGEKCVVPYLMLKAYEDLFEQFE